MRTSSLKIIKSTEFSSNYVKRRRKKKQEWGKKSPILTTKIAADPEHYFRDVSLGERLLLNALFMLDIRHRFIYVSQDKLAERAGITRQHCNYLLDRFEKVGIISSNYRHMTSCEYKVSSYFNNPHIRSALSHIFSAFRGLSLALLTQLNIQGCKDNNLLEKLGKRSGFCKNFVDICKSSVSVMEKLAFSVFGKDPLSPVVRSLEFLSFEEMLKMSAFPDEALKHGKKMYERVSNVRDPYRWLFKVCSVYCRENDIQQDWAIRLLSSCP